MKVKQLDETINIIRFTNETKSWQKFRKMFEIAATTVDFIKPDQVTDPKRLNLKGIFTNSVWRLFFFCI